MLMQPFVWCWQPNQIKYLESPKSMKTVDFQNFDQQFTPHGSIRSQHWLRPQHHQWQFWIKFNILSNFCFNNHAHKWFLVSTSIYNFQWIWKGSYLENLQHGVLDFGAHSCNNKRPTVTSPMHKSNTKVRISLISLRYILQGGLNQNQSIGWTWLQMIDR